MSDDFDQGLTAPNLSGEHRGPMRRLRSALYIDFDNVFGGLLDLDDNAAFQFASSPVEWLARLAGLDLHGEARRDFLIRRCYLNPHGWRYHTSFPNGKVYFDRYRPLLIRAGFEVIDCPPLTIRSKNAADIRMAIDIVDSLTHSTRFDEYIVFSADADFTPVLRRVREYDRRTIIVSTGQTAPAFQSVADSSYDLLAIVRILTPPEGTPTVSNLAADLSSAEHSPAQGVGSSARQTSDVAREATAIVEGLLAESSGPVLMTTVAETLRTRLGFVVDSSNWFGRGSLGTFLSAGPLSRLRRSQHHVWDPDRHEPPADKWARSLPEGLAQVADVTGMPRLTHEEYASIFRSLATFLLAHPFDLTRITQSVRDELASEGLDVGRNAIGFVVQGAMYGGLNWRAQPPASASEISQHFFDNIVQLAASRQFEVSDEVVHELRAWLDI